MTVAAVHFLTVFISDDLSHRERDPGGIIERFGSEDETIIEALETQCIFQVFVNIEQITVEDHEVQFIPWSIVSDEAAD